MWLDDHIRNNKNWQKAISQFPIAFSQVREDPRVDTYLARLLDKPSSGIMIASGGCTSTVLASLNLFSNLTLVDMNPSQIALNQLKFHLLENGDIQHRLGILGHSDMRPEGRGVYLQDFLKRYGYDQNMFGEFAVVSELGPDFAGRYELLFSRLHHGLNNIMTHIHALLEMYSPTEQSSYLSHHPHVIESLGKTFNDVLALPNLVQLFGEQATQNAIRPFPDHFFQRTLHALTHLPAATNPYLCQFLTNSFGAQVSDWLMLPPQILQTAITYFHGSMDQALNGKVQAYDFIHLSNILDWLNPHQAHDLLSLAHRALKPDGIVVIRQLNSHLNFKEVYPNLSWQEDLAENLHETDRSFFYQKLYVARR